MGIDGFFPALLPNFKSNNAKPLQVYGGKRLGVDDVSIWLHPIVKCVDVALTLHMEPKYPLDNVVSEMQRRHSLLTSAGFDVRYVFNGKSPPNKQRMSRQKRRNEIEDAGKRLEAFYEKGKRGQNISEDERKKATKDMATHTFPGEEVASTVKEWMDSQNIKHENAPSEADTQLVALQTLRKASNHHLLSFLESST